MSNEPVYSVPDMLLAAHEAGHAVVALALGWGIQSVTIDGDDGKGLCCFKSGCRPRPDDDEAWRVLWRDHAIVTISGYIAQRHSLHAIRAARELDLTEQDEYDLVDCAKGDNDHLAKIMHHRLDLDTDQARAFFLDVSEQSATLLHRHRGAWIDLTDALLERRTVDGTEIPQLIA